MVVGRWLGRSNKYGGDGIRLLDQDVKKNRVRQRELIQYMSASALMHVFDGWSYLGRAVGAAGSGDLDRSLHLAYYAALRACLGLLATQGVGVFRGVHFAAVIPRKAIVALRDIGTHQVAWLALEHWANRANGGDLIAEVIQPGGIPLRDWLAEASGGHPWRRVASRWLSLWGTDVRRFAEDRELRNAASYRPGGLGPGGVPLASEFAQYLLELWPPLEPSVSNQFDRLDRHLLRIAMEQVHLETAGMAARGDPAFVRTVQQVLGNVSPVTLSPGWEEFLLRTADPEDFRILGEASTPLIGNETRLHFQVIARGVMLLRVATGAARKLRVAAALSPGDLDVWRLRMIRERGFWGSSGDPADFLDLWADVALALGEVQGWAGAGWPKNTYRGLLDTHAAEVATLAGLERVSLWSI